MKLKIYYRNPPAKDGKSQVYITYSHAGKPTIKIDSGLRNNPNISDPVMEQNIRDKYYEIEKVVSVFYHDHNHTYPTPDELMAVLERPEVATDQVTKIYQSWLDRSTFRSKKLHKTVINDIDKAIPNFTLSMTTIENIDRIKNYWIGLKIGNNTTTKRMQFFMRFLRSQDKTMLKPNQEFKNYEMVLKSAKREDNIFTLTEHEFTVLFNFRFSKPTRQYAVNLYLLSCATSLRISDVTKVTKDSVKPDKNGVMRVMVPIDKLDGKLSNVPLNSFSQNIIYDRDIDRTMAQQHIREYLKEAFEEAIPLMPKSFVEETTHYQWIGGYPDRKSVV